MLLSTLRFPALAKHFMSAWRAHETGDVLVTNVLYTQCCFILAWIVLLQYMRTIHA